MPADLNLFMPSSMLPEVGNLYIMRGVPGCGKTHRAIRLASEVNGLILSADHFYGNGEEYLKNWSREKAHLGHRDCEAKCLSAMKNKTKHVIIDNTNIALQNFRYYLDAAVDHNYSVYLVYPDSQWWNEIVLPCLRNKTDQKIKDSAKLLFQKTVHGVPEATIVDMLSRFHWVTYEEYLDSCEEQVKSLRKELTKLETRLDKVSNLYL